ncbi:thiamine pyrophosphate-binding protein, partial [Campylobacter coli]
KYFKHILVRHEQAAVHAADAYARMSGEVGVAVVTSGPGFTNTFAHVKNQRMIFKNKQKELYQKYKRVSYRDFLISESLSGNE